MGKETSTPQTARAIDSRERVKAAARRVFQREGFTESRVNEIAAEAGVAVGTLYRYFCDKREILLELFQDFYQTLYVSSRSPWEPSDLSGGVYETTVRYFKLYSENADLYSDMGQLMQNDREAAEIFHSARKLFYDRIYRALERWKVVRAVRPDVDSNVAAALLGGMTEQYAYLAYVTGQLCADDMNHVASQIAQMWCFGVQEIERIATLKGEFHAS